MKYIVVSYIIGTETFEEIVIFPKIFYHDKTAESIIHAMFREDLLYPEVVSAGFVNLEKLQCFGKSESLDLESRPNDSMLLKRDNRYG